MATKRDSGSLKEQLLCDGESVIINPVCSITTTGSCKSETHLSIGVGLLAGTNHLRGHENYGGYLAHSLLPLHLESLDSRKGQSIEQEES